MSAHTRAHIYMRARDRRRERESARLFYYLFPNFEFFENDDCVDGLVEREEMCFIIDHTYMNFYCCYCCGFSSYFVN